MITTLERTEKIYTPLEHIRNRHIFGCDLLALLLMPTLALFLRLDYLGWWSQFGQALLFFTFISMLVKLTIFYHFGLYRRYWRYGGVNDLTLLLKGVGLATLVLIVLFVTPQDLLADYKLASPRTLPFIDGLLTGLVVSSYRFGLRWFYDRQHCRRRVVGGRRTLVVGAGEAGTLVVREMRANPQLNMEPVAFVDDDPLKIQTRVQGLVVLGSIDQLPELVKKHQIQRLIVTLPSTPLGRQREILELCQRTGVPTDCLPGMYELLAGSKTITPVPRVDIHQLLRRKPVETNQAEVATLLTGATVLVTGAGGSIGSELCRQIARFGPQEIILLGHGENSIFEIALDLRLSFPELTTHSAIVDVRNKRQVTQVVEAYRPQVIFHAAAHKHVPFMEANIEEAISNNVLGTKNVVAAAEQYSVERLVLISSDKAVNPSSVMGATKRLAELLVVAAARRTGRAYMAVRFGNVLGSRGSVIPIFQRQIAAGGPLTITHPDMRRYFMTIPEAVQLVLQAGVLGQGGEVFVLDMGQPVRILDLASDLIQLSGLKPGRDIKIVYSGIRPGEKLYEELFLNGEEYRRTRHTKIFAARSESSAETELLEQVAVAVTHLTQPLQTPASAAQLKSVLPKICYYLDQYQPKVRTRPRVQTPTPLPLPRPTVMPSPSQPPHLQPRPAPKAL